MASPPRYVEFAHPRDGGKHCENDKDDPASQKLAYSVLMDDLKRPITVDADALEPILLVRGDAKQGETWQRAYPASKLAARPRRRFTRPESFTPPPPA